MSVNDTRTKVEAEASGVSSGDDDPRNRPKDLQNASERPCKWAERQVGRNSPQPAQDRPNGPGREADAPRASTGDEDPRNQPKKPIEVSERISERAERQVQQNSPGRAPSELVEPGPNADTPNEFPSTREGPQSHWNDRVDETNVHRRDPGPGGAEGEPGESGLVECDRTHDSNGDVSHGTQGCPRGDGNECDVDMNVPGRDTLAGRGGRVEVVGNELPFQS